MTEATAVSIRFHTTNPELSDFYREVIDGLTRRPRSIPPKYFYDVEGSRLFEAICKQPEYYPTRTEMALLEQYAGEIAALIRPGCYLIEPGSGSCEKVRLLLDLIEPQAYVPLDICCEHLKTAANKIAREFPGFDVHAVCTDITDSLSLPFIPADAQRVIFYPGSSIGNFDPCEAERFLEDLARIAGVGGGLLIGVDLKKPPERLNAAYNDASGVTAAFNLNLLHRINRELGADLDVSSFDHYAFYNKDEGRIEMHLVSNCTQSFHVDGHHFELEAGDNIHTENSYKYTIEEFRALAIRAGFTSGAVWTDPERLFSVHYMHVQDVQRRHPARV